MIELTPCTIFKRWDNDKQEWVHNHLEWGHLKNPKKALTKGDAFKIKQGFLDKHKKFCDGSIMMEEKVKIIQNETD